MSKEKIIFLSTKEPFTTQGWSGIPYFMYKSLQEYYDVVYVKSPELRYIKLFGYYINKLLTAVGIKKIFFDTGLIVSALSGLINTRLIKKHHKALAIFCPSDVAAICFLNTRIPIVYCSDCSLLQIIGYYPALSNVMPLSISVTRYLEKRALGKSAISIFSSSWAADFVKDQYSLSKVHVIPFGANLAHEHTFAESGSFQSNKCTLIFVGVDWKRKGGDIAIDIRQQLEASGIETTLIIVGAAPASISGEKIEVVRNLIKHQQEDEYAGLFRRADFMILPTIADCTPVVIAESFAFGVPVLATDTGGIGCMIHHGEDGFVINSRNAKDFVDVILDTLQDNQKRKSMASYSYQSYCKVFNWKKWSADVAALIKLNK